MLTIAYILISYLLTFTNYLLIIYALHTTHDDNIFPWFINVFDKSEIDVKDSICKTRKLKTLNNPISYSI